MTVLVLLFFIVCPILSFPFLYIGLRRDKRHKNIYLMIIALFIALFAFIYRPTPSEDLYRHHLDTMQYQDVDVEELGDIINREPEQLTIIYKFLISKTGNPDLLQFFTTAISCFLLLYLLSEYSSKHPELTRFKKIAVWIFVLSTFHFIVIISNIFYTLALEIFSVGVYFDYVKNKRKIMSWLFYILPVFIHTSAIFALVLMLLYKCLGSKINKKSVLILVISILLISVVLPFMSSLVELPIVTEISNLYNAYFRNEEYWSNLHTWPVLMIYLSKLVPVFLAHWICKSKNSIAGFSLFVGIAVLALFFQTSFSIRYIHIAVLCSIPAMFESLTHKKYSQLYMVSLYIFAFPQIVYQIHQFSTGLGKFDTVRRIMLGNLFTTLEGQ